MTKIALMDSNNYQGNCGVGEREARRLAARARRADDVARDVGEAEEARRARDRVARVVERARLRVARLVVARAAALVVPASVQLRMQLERRWNGARRA